MTAKRVLYLKNQITRLQSTILGCSSLLKYVLNVNHTMTNITACSRHHCEPQAIITYSNRADDSKLHKITLQNFFIIYTEVLSVWQ